MKKTILCFAVLQLWQPHAIAEEITLPENSHLTRLVGKAFPDHKTPDSGYWTRRHAHYLIDAGWTHYNKKQYDKALEQFVGAIAMDDTDASAYYGVAYVCSVRNQLDDAIVFYRLSLKYDQGHTHTFANLAKALLLKNPRDSWTQQS
jgi:tetratricopeptide (TPR) repeat protein